ncbi:uncharacterized protein LOC110032748 [Phalaenopsis equestris]|uniref:uncharacterized protein LOC110032748 n=1 Tax=Phalaenopsis equestris TaxID=78828 RepID=UPI0009E1A80A|nr:uncharacterized protein LOC110032748 [Phalaenopsis equestris]XP_020592163.1 uncharacterized protein LOC110032748 [Phalaenopsis equestris]
MKLCVDRSHGSAVELAIPYGCGDSILQDLVSASIECPSLKVVELLEMSLDVVEKLPALISKWKELEILKIPLQLFSFTQILEQIRINCPKFIGLHLHGYFSNRRIKAIVRCVPRLKILVIDGARIKKNDLMEMLDGCNELQLFSASDCAGFKVDAEILMKTSNIKKVEFKNTPTQCKIEIDYFF